jgi:hypothetical protein
MKRSIVIWFMMIGVAFIAACHNSVRMGIASTDPAQRLYPLLKKGDRIEWFDDTGKSLYVHFGIKPPCKPERYPNAPAPGYINHCRFDPSGFTSDIPYLYYRCWKSKCADPVQPMPPGRGPVLGGSGKSARASDVNDTLVLGCVMNQVVIDDAPSYTTPAGVTITWYDQLSTNKWHVTFTGGSGSPCTAKTMLSSGDNCVIDQGVTQTTYTYTATIDQCYVTGSTLATASANIIVTAPVQ